MQQPPFIPTFDVEQALSQVPTLPGIQQAANQDPFIGPGGTELPGNAYVRGLVTDPYANEPGGPVRVDRPGDSANMIRPRRVEHPGGEQAFATTHPFTYRRSDVTSTLFDLSPAQVLVLQNRMVEAGLMSKATGNPGDSVTAMQEVMGYANIHGLHWREALTSLTSQAQLASNALNEGTSGQGGAFRRQPVFNFDPYLPPDYDTLATNIEQLFRDHLGREPEPHELTILADKMNALYRGDYDAQYQAALQKFEAGEFAETQADVDQATRARDDADGTDDPLTDPAPNPLVNPAETGPEQVDVASSTYQFFKQRYANELERVEQMRQMMANRQLTASSLLGLQSMVAGQPNEL